MTTIASHVLHVALYVWTSCLIENILVAIVCCGGDGYQITSGSVTREASDTEKGSADVRLAQTYFHHMQGQDEGSPAPGRRH
jgi:hypothetical protein